MKHDDKKVLRAPSDIEKGGQSDASGHLVPEALLAQGPAIADHYENDELIRALIAGMAKLDKEYSTKYEEQKAYIKKKQKDHEKKIEKQQEEHFSSNKAVIGAFRDFVASSISDAKQDLSDRFDAKIDAQSKELKAEIKDIKAEIKDIRQMFRTAMYFMVATIITCVGSAASIISFFK